MVWPEASSSRMKAFARRSTDPLYAPASPRLLVMTSTATLPVRSPSPGRRSSGCSTFPTLAASSFTSSRTFCVYGLVPTARLRDFWNFAVAIICIVLVILRMFRTALRRLTIARAFAMRLVRLIRLIRRDAGNSKAACLGPVSCLVRGIVPATGDYARPPARCKPAGA